MSVLPKMKTVAPPYVGVVGGLGEIASASGVRGTEVLMSEE